MIAIIWKEHPFPRIEASLVLCVASLLATALEPIPVRAQPGSLDVELTARPVYFGDVPSCDVNLDWSDALEVGTAAVDHYDVYRDGVLAGQSSVSLYEDSGAPAGTHTHYVTSIDTSGITSPPLPSVMIDTAGCNSAVDRSNYVVRDLYIQALSSDCDSTQRYFHEPIDKGPRFPLVSSAGRSPNIPRPTQERLS